jgi:hypothetical protein
MLRDFAYYGAFSLLRIARLDREAKLSMLCDEMFEPYTNYLGFSGFPTLEKLSLQLRAVLRENDHDTSERCISAFVMYLNRLYAWAHHFFPWNLGDHFKYPTTLTMAPEGAAPTADTLAFDGPEIRLTWKALGISVRAILAETLNPELVADITAALPFTILQQHSVVTGESIFGWGAPIASTAPVRVREEIRLAPIGRLRFSQRTGQKLIIQYGPTTETILAPVLGGVVEEDVHLLDALGRAVWENTYRAKRPIFLEVTTS